jgi:hypothetical protein
MAVVVSIFGVLAGFVAAFVALFHGLPLVGVLVAYAVCGSLGAALLVVGFLLRARDATGDGADWQGRPVPLALGASRETIAARGFATAMTASAGEGSAPRRR